MGTPQPWLPSSLDLELTLGLELLEMVLRSFPIVFVKVHVHLYVHESYVSILYIYIRTIHVEILHSYVHVHVHTVLARSDTACGYYVHCISGWNFVLLLCVRI